MSRKTVREIRPFVSVFIIILALFSVVFVKMEVRRVGYSVLKQGRMYKRLTDKNRKLVTKYARITRSSRVNQLAMTKLTLTRAKRGQVIQMYGTKIALRQ
ncbi:MAG: hypothetical protein KDD61_03125 [Bdellovibrionales bacterium]|nr:hypothetical protein [Bdellovibrionales bacterium]